ncbi:hypothetical protein GE300_11390 [Rhodobacteraceae bacterium 2CG4]|uniref:Uncharacterized protein n=1 Tax=Halovulum marinum TaxID=2662447 RepID=A0A6L5Z2B6_9RHOB|nr:hypothetical protein [Halovulum marinum]MSU90215.1 hypothetical protein [Halovulum marinum]
MHGRDEYVFRHAFRIAERHERYGRTLQSDELKRQVFALGAKFRQGIRAVSAVFGARPNTEPQDPNTHP